MSDIKTEPAKPLFDTDKVGQTVGSGHDFEYSTTTEEFQFKEMLPSRVLALDPRPSQNSLGAIYPDDYEPYLFHELPFFLKKARDLIQVFKIRKVEQFLDRDSRVLDIGCGSGQLLRLLKQRSPEMELHANDLNQECMDTLNTQGINTHCYSYSEIDLENHFDAIILNQVIEHFHEPKALLAKCYELLKPNGVIFIETPSTEGLDSKIFRKRYWGGYHFPRHLYLFSENSLKMLLVQTQFTQVETEYLASPAFWTQSLHHFFHDRGMKKVAKLMHLKNLPLTALFTLVDLVSIIFGSKTSNMRAIAHKQNQ